jgi:hypothetical protein
MQLNKRDLITIIALCVIFFSVATWNVGLVQAPVTTWQGTENRTFYVDIGSSQTIKTAYFFVDAGNATVNIYSGAPGNWTFKTSANIHGDSSWSSVSVGANTQFLQIEIEPAMYDGRPNFYWTIPNPDDVQPHNYIEISEIGLLSSSDQKISITSLTNEGTTDAALANLADEQSFVQCPPTYLSGAYFDEVYFVRAAQDYLNHQTSFERTHPPLGKLIQASSIALFGNTPFGWRIMGVIFGTLMIPLIYMLGKKLLGTWIGGFAAAFLLTFDFLHFTMARMGTADTYVVFFSMLTQLFFLIYFTNVVKQGWKTSVWPLFLAFVCFALGFSTKWLSMWAALGMVALLIGLRLRDVVKVKGWSAKYQAFFDHPFLLMLGFVGVVAVIYFVTYIPDMLTGTSFVNVVNLQFQMYNFHATLTATHQFMSSWWSWPFMVSPHGYVPLWLSITYLPNSVDSTISAMGNPAVWWVGFAAVLVVIERAIRGEEAVAALKRKLGGVKVRLGRKPKAVEALAMAPELTVSADVSAEQPQVLPDPVVTEPSTTPETSTPKGRPWDIAAIFIATIFLFSWLPYIFISRATFIYHFYISTPLLCLATAYLINLYWNTRKGKVATLVFFAVVIGMFIAFYPVIAGMPVSTSWIHALKWFPSWFFAP